MKKGSSRLSRINYAVLIGSAALALALGIAALRQSQPAWAHYTGSAEVRIITPTLTGKPELCLTCHYGIEQIDTAHPVESFGCVLCHGGDGLSLDETGAHEGLRGGANPADLSVVQESCGSTDCHSGSAADARNHIQRVEDSLQATYAGAIEQVLVSFNQVPADGPHYGIAAAQDDQVDHADAVSALLSFDPMQWSAPVQAFGERCLTCHLHAEPIQQPYYYRGTGCAACHVTYNTDGLYVGGDPTIPRDEAGHPALHQMTLQMPFSTCNACHNRGNYSLAQMNFLPRDDLSNLNPLLSTTERRLAEYYQPIGQFTKCEWELDCIDCHTANEAMGDGDIHISQYDAEQTQCKTCHGTLTEPPTFKTVTEPNGPAIRRANLNPFLDVQVGDQILLAPDGDTMEGVKLVDGQVMEIGKVTGVTYNVPLVMGSACEQKPDEQESRYCHACHAVDRSQPVP